MEALGGDAAERRADSGRPVDAAQSGEGSGAWHWSGPECDSERELQYHSPGVHPADPVV